MVDLGRIKNRVQKTLEDGNIKWGSITSNVFGKSGLQILRLLADGVTDASRLSFAVTRIKRKEEARKSLTNCFTNEHIFLIKELLSQYDHLSERILNTDNELFELVKPYRHLVDKLDAIPGIDEVWE